LPSPKRPPALRLFRPKEGESGVEHLDQPASARALRKSKSPSTPRWFRLVATSWRSEDPLSTRAARFGAPQAHRSRHGLRRELERAGATRSHSPPAAVERPPPVARSRNRKQGEKRPKTTRAGWATSKGPPRPLLRHHTMRRSAPRISTLRACPGFNTLRRANAPTRVLARCLRHRAQPLLAISRPFDARYVFLGTYPPVPAGWHGIKVGQRHG